MTGTGPAAALAVPVAAVMVSRNSATDLPAGLTALKAAAVAETVVVDNASMDGSAAVARAAGARVIDNHDNRGYGAGLNQGMAATASEAVLCLNADVTVRSWTVQRLWAVMQEHPSIGLIAPRLFHPDGTLQPSVNRRFPGISSYLADVTGLAGLKMRLYRGPFVSRALGPLWYGRVHHRTRRVAWVGGACFLVRRSAWNRVGGFDEGFLLYYEEVDFCRRLAAAGWETWFCAEAEAVHGWGSSTAAEPALAAQAARRSRRRYFSRHGGWASHLVGGAPEPLSRTT